MSEVIVDREQCHNAKTGEGKKRRGTSSKKSKEHDVINVNKLMARPKCVAEAKGIGFSTVMRYELFHILSMF